MGMGFMPVLMMLLQVGGMGMLGVPPQGEDARLQALAPENCLVYVYSAGYAAPDGDSKNRTEALMAEEEVQAVFAQLDAAIRKKVTDGEYWDPDQKIVAEAARELVTAMATNPFAAYLSHFNPTREKADIRAAVVLKPGDDMGAVKRAMTSIETLALKENRGARIQEDRFLNVAFRRFPIDDDEAPSIHWGVVADKYVVLAIGQGTATHVVRQLTESGATAPAWLATVKGEMAPERLSTLSYVNAGALRDQILTIVAREESEQEAAQARKVIEALGIDKLGVVATVSGLGEEAFVSRTSVEVDGKMTGLLSPFAGKSLTHKEVAHIPQDASVAGAARVDAGKMLQLMRSVLEQIDRRQVHFINGMLDQLSGELEMDFEDDVLGSLGDVWTIHNSPSDGGMLLTGAVLSVSVKDHKKLNQAHERILAKVREGMNAHGDRAPMRLREITVGKQVIHYLLPGGDMADDLPIAPAWCLTGDRLLVGLFPQMVRAQLTRKPTSVVNVNVFKAQSAMMRKHGGPVMFMRVDERKICERLYPAMPFLVTMLSGKLEEEGFSGLDVSILPSAGAIMPHLDMHTTAVYRTEQGLLMESHGTIPAGGPAGGGIMPMFLGVGFWSLAAVPADVQTAEVQYHPSPYVGPKSAATGATYP